MKKVGTIFTAILVPLDFIALLGAGLAAYFLRFNTLTEIKPVFYEISFSYYITLLSGVSLVWLLIFALSGLYRMKNKMRWVDESIKIIIACSAGIMLVIIAVFLNRDLFSSRFIILASWFLAMLFVILGHSILRIAKKVCLRRGIGTYNIVLVGQDKIAEEIASKIYRDVSLGYRIVARIKFENEINFEKLSETLAGLKDGVDEIIQADPNLPREINEEVLDFCNQNHVIFKYAADMFNTQATNISVETIAGIPVIEIKKTPLEGWGRIIKRIIDIIGSVLGLIFLAPFLAAVAIAVKLDSSGPAIIGLERVGEKKQTFTLYKFRSMIVDAHKMKQELLDKNERSGPLFKMKEDPRVTRLGAFIRRVSLDEFPQLWNVLRGDMSLVGPRPHEPEEVRAYAKHHKRLLDIKPGITGMAQISGRADLDFEDEVRLDTYYIENWSIKLDLHILLKTPGVVLKNRGAK